MFPKKERSPCVKKNSDRSPPTSSAVRRRRRRRLFLHCVGLQQKEKKKQNPKHLYLGYHFPKFSQKKPSSNGSFVCLVSIYRFFAFKRPRRRREIITKPSSSTRERTRTSQSRRRRHVFSAGGICRETALVARRRRVRGASGKVFVLEKKIPTSFRRNYVICVFAGMNGMHVCLSFRVLFLRRSSTI